MTPTEKLKKLGSYLTKMQTTTIGFYVRWQQRSNTTPMYFCKMCGVRGATTQEIEHKTECPIQELLNILKRKAAKS